MNIRVERLTVGWLGNLCRLTFWVRGAATLPRLSPAKGWAVRDTPPIHCAKVRTHADPHHPGLERGSPGEHQLSATPSGVAREQPWECGPELKGDHPKGLSGS